MSKKAVSRALRALDAGAEPADIDGILSGVTETFLRRRLRSLIDSGDSGSGPAQRLWTAKFGDSRLVPSTRDAKSRDRVVQPPVQGSPEGAAPEPAGGESPPTSIRLDDPTPLLSWVTRNHSGVFSLATLKRFEVWGVVATATLARSESSGPLTLTDYDRSAAGRFAQAIGAKDLVRGVVPPDHGEPGRTAKLRRLKSFGEIEDAAREISHLLVRNEEERDTRLTVKYVVVELLRNVIQHSNDELGGVVAAQRMDHQDPSSLQVAVADAGVGIFDAMIEKHPNLRDHGEALEKALWPHFSGTFEEGLSGSRQNAGLGLFFISEMAKLTGGRLLLASHGASLLLTADPDAGDNHEMKFLKPDGLGYPGTLVAFELPNDSVANYDELIRTIQRRAREAYAQARTTSLDPVRPVTCQRQVLRRAVHIREHRTGGEVCAGAAGAPNPEEGSGRSGLSRDGNRHPELPSRAAVRRFAPGWAKQSFIYVVNASPSVRSGIELIEAYALGG